MFGEKFQKKYPFLPPMLKTFGIALLLYLCSRNPDKEVRINADMPRFKITESSRTFFRNVRGLYYDVEENTNAKLDFYRNSDLPKADSSLRICPVIVISEDNREAYVFLEIITQSPQISDTLSIVIAKETQNEERLRFFRTDREGYFRLAGRIYNAILDKKPICLSHENKEIPFFRDENEMQVFRKTLLDYYRLTQTIK